MIEKWQRALGFARKCGNGRYINSVRTMVGKAWDRAGVHGSGTPNAKSLDNEDEIRERINKGKEDKEEKTSEVEKKVQGSLKGSNGDNGSSSR